MSRFFAVLLALLMLPPLAGADDKKTDPIAIPQIDVIGRKASALDNVPGSGSIVDQRRLDEIKPSDAGEVLRTLPGLNVVGEDGMSLRLNVGIRGLDPDRSRRLLVLEDGIPISLNPYGEPELYYSPAIERMKGLELLKGSGSIVWGPQTIGGVLNFITRDPPKRFSLGAEASYGSYDFLLARLHVGDTVGNFGYLIEAMHKRFAGPRSLNLGLTDISAKFVIRPTAHSSLGIKLHFYDELSNATYLGLTTPQYQNNPFANAAIYDVLPIRRYGVSLAHKVFFGAGGTLQTNLYGYTVSRFWQRQDFDRKRNPTREYERVVDGENRSTLDGGSDDGSSIFFRKSTGNRNRSYAVGGAESRYMIDFTTGPVAHEFQAGLRLHYEHADEQRLNGQRGDSPSGLLVEDEERGLFAFAAFAQYRLMFLDRRLQITPGFRFEVMQSHRTLFRGSVTDPTTKQTSVKDLDISQDTLIFAPIPGLGISFQALRGLTLFAGVHRGFAPPSTKDAVTPTGQDIELEAEYSWNYEAGIRYRFRQGLSAEITGFFMDFQNQIIPPSESSGAVSADPRNQGKPFVNAGRTFHAGLEASTTIDFASLFSAGFRLPLTVSYTYLPLAVFADPDSIYYNNRLPYAPEHLLSSTLAFAHAIGLSASVTLSYVTGQFTDSTQTLQATRDGLQGEIAGRFLLDARIAYTFQAERWSLGAYILGKNLTDERYIASRRPQGIQPGMPRMILGGIQGSY